MIKKNLKTKRRVRYWSNVSSSSSVLPNIINAFKQSKRSVYLLFYCGDNEPGILARIVGLFSGRGYNIEALNVTVVDIENNLSRITIETLGEEKVIRQIIAQLEKLVPVHSATNLAHLKESYEAEICLVKIEFDNEDQDSEILNFADIYRTRTVKDNILLFMKYQAQVNASINF